MVHFGEFLKIWSLRSNSVTRQISFNRTKIGGKCQNWKIQMRHFGKEDHGLHSSVDASSAISMGKKSQTWDLVWVTGGPLETIFVNTFFQLKSMVFFSNTVCLLGTKTNYNHNMICFIWDWREILSRIISLPIKETRFVFVSISTKGCFKACLGTYKVK